MKQKKHWWYVTTGLYHKPIKVLTTGMTEAREEAYRKFVKMNIDEFQKYIPLDVHGSRPL